MGKVIPAEAVDASIKGFTMCAKNPAAPSSGDVFKECLTAALEAAAPHMLQEAKAEAWDEGCSWGSIYDHTFRSDNPYRTTK